jgi:hypothetical protein
MDVTTTDLTVERFAQLEAIIERGQQTFLEVGQALAEIRDRRGYRVAGYASFEAYCQERWAFGRQSAWCYIRAAEATANVKSILQPEAAEPGYTQAIELSRLPPDEQRVVAQAVDFSAMSVRELHRLIDDKLGRRVVPLAQALEPPPETIRVRVEVAPSPPPEVLHVRVAPRLPSEVIHVDLLSQGRAREKERVEARQQWQPLRYFELLSDLTKANHLILKALRICEDHGGYDCGFCWLLQDSSDNLERSLAFIDQAIKERLRLSDAGQ